MRIPSHRDDRHPGLRNPQATSLGGYRRVLGLCIALAMVLVLMKKAGDPRAYRLFFSQDSADESTDRPPPISAPAPSSPESASGDSLSEHQTDALQLQLQPLTASVGQLTGDQRSELVAYLAGATPTATSQALDELASAVVTSIRTSGEATLLSESEQNALSESSAHTLQNATLRERLQSSLDRFYLGEMTQAGGWSRENSIAFLRMLRTGGRVQGQTHRVSVTSLLSQWKYYWHKPVVIPGNLARLEKITARKNPVGVDSYYRVWLQPLDNSQLPFAFFSETLPQELEPYLGRDYVASGPTIQAEGIFLHRLAFESKQGHELAPVIVGRLPMNSSLASSGSIPTTSDVIPWGWLGVAAGVGLAVAAAIVFAGRVHNQQLHRIRFANRTLDDSFQVSQETPSTSDP